MSRFVKRLGVLLLLVHSGCSGRDRFKTPQVDSDAAAAAAIELYDANGDAALNKDELAKCPGMLARLQLYDRDTNGSIEQEEIAQHLGAMLNRVGGTPLSASVTYRGKVLAGAKIVLEPEPYLGEQIQPAQGETDAAGLAELTIAPEHVPERLRRFKLVHYGTFKVRITHPTISLPAKYNAETELGYETEPGKPNVTFDLKG